MKVYNIQRTRHKLCVEIGEHDPLFDSKFGVEFFEKLKDICGDRGTQWFGFIVFDGNHEFHKDDTPIKRLVQDLITMNR